MTSCVSPFLALLEAEWSHAQLIRLLTHEDVVCLALMAIECDVEWLRHRLLHAPGPLQPISSRSLMQYAAIRGWWRHVALLIPKCRRWCGWHAARANMVKEAVTNVSQDMVFLLCQQILRRHLVKFEADVMYAAAERGVLAEIVWLHRYTDYVAKEASVKAASAGHVEVLEWLLDHNTTARKRRALHNTQIEFILRQRESPFQATCWCVASMSYCYIVGVGLLPPRYFVEPDQKLYPLTDWVAKQCGLSLLRRLHEDSMWEATFSEQIMSVSAANGDLATRDWLLSNGCQYFQDVNSMYEVAAEHGHVDDLDWLYAHISTPENALHALTTALLESQIDAARWFLTHFRDKALTLRGPYHFAIRSGNLETFKFVCEEWGPAPINYIVQAAVYGRYDMVLWLMETQGESIRESQDGTNSLLNAAVSGGNLKLVQWCVEELGASPLTALDAAAKHADIKALQYLVGVLEEEAPLHGDISQHQANDVVINAVQILAKTARHGEFVEADIQWVLEQFPERDAQLTAGNVAAFVLVHQSPLRETPPWTTTRAFLRYRPRFCCLVPLFPQWVVRFGDLFDLKTLEDIKHPMLYTKETMSCLLKYSRNADIMMRIVVHCDSSVVSMRVARWASKYGAVGLLKSLHQIFTAQNQDRAFFGSVLSSAVRYEQTAVLEWLGCRQYPDTVHLKWCSVAKMAARHGLLSSLLWLRANEKIHVHQMDELTGIVATNGHLRCLRGLEKELQVKCSLEDAIKARERGHIDLYEYAARNKSRGSV